MSQRVNYGGLVIAGIGFFLTRFTVTLAFQSPLQFYFAGVVPLALGLGLAAFGVALAVADVDPVLVRTTALWCVVGAGAMGVLVALTLLGSTPSGLPTVDAIRSRTALSNFLIGGSVGGTLTGVYAARNRDQRATLRHQTHRLEVLNRLLRHEVLNALTVIRGYASLEDSDDADAVIAEYTDAIEETIEDVKYLTRSVGAEAGGSPVDLGACLTESVSDARTRYPDATITVDIPEGDPSVRAGERLDTVFSNLLENAVIHGSPADTPVAVSVTTTPTAVRVAVSDAGPGLPESQRALLEEGEIEEFDDPTTGFGLNVVRFLVESYGGTVETDTGEEGTTVTVVLGRTETRSVGVDPSKGLSGVRPAAPQLLVVFGAALVAGVSYGVAAELLGGSVAAIGVFYGIQDPLVGWLTHEFHSVVFGFVYAGIVSLAPARYRDHLPAYAVIGVGWALCLWGFAAGVVAPVWLQLLGFPASVPNLSLDLLVSHLAWGVSLGVLTAWGYDRVGAWPGAPGSGRR